MHLDGSGFHLKFKKPIPSNALAFDVIYNFKDKPEEITEEDWKNKCDFIKNNTRQYRCITVYNNWQKCWNYYYNQWVNMKNEPVKPEEKPVAQYRHEGYENFNTDQIKVTFTSFRDQHQFKEVVKSIELKRFHVYF